MVSGKQLSRSVSYCSSTTHLTYKLVYLVLVLSALITDIGAQTESTGLFIEMSSILETVLPTPDPTSSIVTSPNDFFSTSLLEVSSSVMSTSDLLSSSLEESILPSSASLTITMTPTQTSTIVSTSLFFEVTSSVMPTSTTGTTSSIVPSVMPTSTTGTTSSIVPSVMPTSTTGTTSSIVQTIVATPTLTTKPPIPPSQPPPGELPIVAIAAGGAAAAIIILIVFIFICCCCYCFVCKSSATNEYNTGNDGHVRPFVVVRTFTQDMQRSGSLISRGSRNSFARGSLTSIASSLRRLSGKRRSKKDGHILKEESITMKVTPL